MRGSVIDLAVGVVIGAAFGRIVSSLVSDIVTPLISLLTGAVDFKELTIVLRGGEAPVALNYGTFFQSIFDFLIIAAAIFFALKFINALRRRFETEKETAVGPTPPRTYQEKLLEEIRDILRRNGRP